MISTILKIILNIIIEIDQDLIGSMKVNILEKNSVESINKIIKNSINILMKKSRMF